MEASRIVDLLPDVFRRAVLPDQPLDLLLRVMEHLHAPVEAVLEEFDAHIDPYRCPDAFVPFLAHWVGLGWLVSDETGGGTFATGDGPLRDVVTRGERLARLRGTAVGMSAFLVLATGSGPFEVTTSRDPFHLVVRGPAEVRPHRNLVERIVRHEKPAFTSASIALGDEPEQFLDRRWGQPAAPSSSAPPPPPPPPPPPAHAPSTGAPDA